MVKVGIVGCGGIGRHHAKALAEMGNVRVVAVCDVIRQRADRLAEMAKCRAVTDYRELLDDVDAVWICTEPAVRVELISAIAAAGKHIFCEKPIALNIAEADEIIRIVDAAGVKFMLGYVLRFTEPFRLLRKIFATGELGRLVNCWTRRYMVMDPRKTWHNQQEASGGVALDFGSHDIDWLMWIGGSVKTVFARADRVRYDVHSDEHAQSMLAFAGGGMANCDVSWLDTAGESSIGIIGSEGSIIVDRAGTVRKKMVGEQESQIKIDGAMSVKPDGDFEKVRSESDGEMSIAATETIQEHFVRCIEEDIPPSVTARAGRDVLRTVLAINESARTGKAVNVGTA